MNGEPRQQVDLIFASISQLVTCASDGPKRGEAMRDPGIIEDGAIAVKDGVIVGIGRTGDVLDRFEHFPLEDCEGRCVVPGFVDCHTHAVWAGNRLDEFEQRIGGATYLDILERGGGILSTVGATRRSGDLEALAAHRLLTMLALGTTTVEIKTGYGLSTESERLMLEAIRSLDADLRDAFDIVPTFLGAHAVPPEFAGDADGYIDLVIGEMLPMAARFAGMWPFSAHPVPMSVDVFCERGAFTLEQSRRVLAAAGDLGLAVRAHLDEFTDLGGVRMAVELGALSVDHLDVTGPDGIAALAASDTVGVVLPAVNVNLGGTRFADARGMIDAGAIVALATDLNPGSAPCYSLPLVMAIACRYQKLLPAEALNAVTINAAHALGLGSTVGSLEVGKQADFVMLDAPDYRALAYDLGVNHAWRVYKRGREVARNGRAYPENPYSRL